MSLNTILCGKMRLVYISLLFALSETQKPFEDIDLNPYAVESLPVPFGHIFRGGWGNPTSDLKEPIDMLEFSLRAPEDMVEAKRLLQSSRKERILFLKPKLKNSKVQDDFPELEEPDSISSDKNSTDIFAKMPSIADIQTRNAMNPPRTGLNNQNKKEINILNEWPYEVPLPQESKFRPELFEEHGFDLASYRKVDNKLNWTTCDEFGSTKSFHPRDIVDIDWVPFYIWSVESFRIATVHRFTYPTQKLVKQFYDDYHLYINKTVDWKQPKLMMKGISEILLVAVDKKGLFTGIPRHSLPSSIKDKDFKVPVLTVKIKIDDPYLVLIFCDKYFATVMAVAGDEPSTYKEKVAEAASVGFKGTGRPVWRDLKEEMIRDKMLQLQKKVEEDSKVIKIADEHLPTL